MMPTTLQRTPKSLRSLSWRIPDAKEWNEPVKKAAWYISHGFVAAVMMTMVRLLPFVRRDRWTGQG